MKRRELLAGLGTYSLVVKAQDLVPARPDFARIAPAASSRQPSPDEPHMTRVDLASDVFIAGGGLAGCCAALAAARHGAKVVLVQDRSRLGGNSSSEVKMHVVGATCHKGRPGWREGGIIEEIRLDDAARNPHRSWELWDLLLYEKLATHPNITLLLETTLYSATKKGDRIESVLARCDRSEHVYRITAPIFLDCTGDSRLALEAGAEMRTGREARPEFNEPLAPEKADNETLGSSILFTSRQYPYPVPFAAPAWARRVTKEHLRFREIASWEYGYWWVEWGGNLDIIRDNERIRYELLSIALGVWDYIKNSGDHPDSANWGMDWLGMMPGRRGSRRIVGDHMLTQGDLLSGDFPDAVAIGGWPMDDHPPGGFDRSDLPPNTVLRPPEVYNIPLRALYSKNVSNLMMAGRNISATHAAFTSTRVMATCAVCGQAAGTAAAMCAVERMSPRQLAQDGAKVSRLQQTLLCDDQTIRGMRNEDASDLARRAKVKASAERQHYAAEKILDGLTRDIPGKDTHHWQAPLPAWIELSWDRPVDLREIQITFDSGFQRELTLSSSDSITKGIVRAAQPETAKAYRLLVDGREVTAVSNNHQRLCRHRLDAPLKAKVVRLEISAAHGSDLARVFEIRCYA